MISTSKFTTSTLCVNVAVDLFKMNSIRRKHLFRKCYQLLKNSPSIFSQTIHDENITNSNAFLKSNGAFSSPFTLNRRFLARFTDSNTLAAKTAPELDDDPNLESWRQSQSEDTYDLDEDIVELLTLDVDRLPKPCDLLTYFFRTHGMNRRFESMPRRWALDSDQFQFTVCSYNVLCQRTLCNYVQKLYSHCPFEHLTWQRRWPLLAVEFRMLNSDVFCLQEVQHDHFEQDYMPYFSKLGYDGAFKKKLGSKSDGCATFWRRDKLRPVLVYPVEYSLPAPHEHSDSVALITVFEPTGDTGSTRRLVVANTHLIYQPACGATKLCQAALLLAHLQKVCDQYSKSLILCGDFNSTPYSPLYSLMVDGRLQYEGLNGWAVSGQQPNQQRQYPPSIRSIRTGMNAIGDQIFGDSLLPDGSSCSESCQLIDGDQNSEHTGFVNHRLNLRSVYDHVTKNGEREVTTFLRDQPVAVDYIFYSAHHQRITPGDPESNSLKCVERYRLPGPSQLDRKIGYLPNKYCASDHLPLMAKFALDV